MKRDFGIIVDKCLAIIFSFCTFIKLYAIGYQRMDPKYFLKVSGQFFSQHPTRLSLLGTDTFMKSLKDRSSHRRCSVKKVFLQISQDSQENTRARVSLLIKLNTSGRLLLKRMPHFYLTLKHLAS